MDRDVFNTILGEYYEEFGTISRSTRNCSRWLSAGLASVSVVNSRILDYPVTSHYVYGALLGGIAVASIGELGARFGEKMQDDIIRYATSHDTEDS